MVAVVGASRRRTPRYSVLLQRAIAAQRGLFDPDACGVGPSAASPLRLWVNWDADGDDTANPSGEWVKIRNLDPVNAVPLGDWYLRDAGLRRFTLPAAAPSIPPGGIVTVDVGTRGRRPTVFPLGPARPGVRERVATTTTRWATARTCSTRSATSARRWCTRAAAVLGPAAGRRRAERGPDRAARVGHAHERHRRRRSTSTATCSRARRRATTSAPGSVLPPGASMRIQVVGDPADDTPLKRHWGFAKPILRDAGDVVRLSTLHRHHGRLHRVGRPSC